MKIRSLAIAIFSLALLGVLTGRTHPKAVTLAGAAVPGPSGYHLTKTIPVGGDSGWDYVAVDSKNRRVYVSHGTHVVVLNADTQATVGDIPDTPGVHGIAIAGDLGRGFISNGRGNNVTVFDTETLKTAGTVATGTNPDAIIYDPVSKRVFAFNGRSKDATVINASDNSVAGTIALGGKPEFAVADGKGSVYVNIEDTSELVHLDARALKELDRWPLKPCEEPSGLAMDLQNRRLFAGCSNKLMAVVNADSGTIVTTVPIGQGVDANAFDPETQLAFSSNGEGTLTVVHEDAPDKYTVLENVVTKRSARTMGLDQKTHNIFLPAADFDPPAQGEQRPKMKAGSFVVLMVSK
jgi:DNA-binding beta-propeller fold protein YncE